MRVTSVSPTGARHRSPACSPAALCVSSWSARKPDERSDRYIEGLRTPLLWEWGGPGETAGARQVAACVRTG
jgi:hypothetical protein